VATAGDDEVDWVSNLRGAAIFTPKIGEDSDASHVEGTESVNFDGRLDEEEGAPKSEDEKSNGLAGASGCCTKELKSNPIGLVEEALLAVVEVDGSEESVPNSDGVEEKSSEGSEELKRLNEGALVPRKVGELKERDGGRKAEPGTVAAKLRVGKVASSPRFRWAVTVLLFSASA